MVSDGAEFTVGNIEKLFEEASQNTKVKLERWVKYYNRRRREVNIKAGSSDSSGSDYQSSSFEEDRPRLDQSQSFRNSESGERRGEQEKKTSHTGNQGGKRKSEINKRKRSIRSKKSFIELYNKTKSRHEATGFKRRNPSSRSVGPQRKRNRGPERQLNKRGLPSSSNSNCPLNKKIQQSEASF
ncbi:hypothetical protein TNCV_3286681 [Trichonephila clavipes]|nr:hypothetical protein TNCV_3286681 [Trichonephila clavipes]